MYICNTHTHTPTHTTTPDTCLPPSLYISLSLCLYVISFSDALMYLCKKRLVPDFALLLPANYYPNTYYK